MLNRHPSNSPMGKHVRRMYKAQMIGAVTGLVGMICVGLWVLIHG